MRIPGLFDQHTHGAMGIDFSGCTAAEALQLRGFYLSHGVTAFLPTLCTLSEAETFKAIETLVQAIETQKGPGAWMAGIHLEGPCLSSIFKGAQNEAYLRRPQLPLLQALLSAGKGHIKLVTLAPELEGGLEAVRFLRARGVAVNIGHSNATFAQTWAAMEAGAVCVSHFMNGMRPFHHHEPGIIGAAFLHPQAKAEQICDGLHLAPETLRLNLKVMGREKLILVSDSVAVAGLEPGQYVIPCFGEPVNLLPNGDARLAYCDSRAGSTLTLERAVWNLAKFTGLSVAEAAQCASDHPKAYVGIQQDAWVDLSDEGKVLAVWMDGQQVYQEG
ncbi:MAG: N-acetylglucosamine-6-phosphate deacetylase [Clostridia bacterium]|nr:N-acetylglucosamine-6-phosphate deacetylase [Clostridia bacterium]